MARKRGRTDEVRAVDDVARDVEEQIAGFALVEARSKAEAIEHAKASVKIAGDGETVIRPIMDGPPEVAA